MKLPLFEQVTRWIDVYTYFNYSDKIREDAYTIYGANANKKGCPHVLAATAVYLSCQANKVKCSLDQASKITYAKRYTKTRKAGLYEPGILRGAKKWKL